jgi:DNA-binding HxlR family transcriptional regulator
MTTPRIGAEVRGSRSGRPIMAALDLLGRRGCLRILWELRSGESQTFRELQAAADTNPSLLNTRLKELREAGLVGHPGDGYALTEDGAELLSALQPFADWAQRWGRRFAATTEPHRRRVASGKS